MLDKMQNISKHTLRYTQEMWLHSYKCSNLRFVSLCFYNFWIVGGGGDCGRVGCEQVWREALKPLSTWWICNEMKIRVNLKLLIKCREKPPEWWSPNTYFINKFSDALDDEIWSKFDKGFTSATKEMLFVISSIRISILS